MSDIPPDVGAAVTAVASDIDDENVTCADLEVIVGELHDTLTPRGILQWLRAGNRSLNGQTPLEMLASGQLERATRAAHAYSSGAYV